MSNALIGYSGNFTTSYPGLIKNPNVAQAIGHEHKKDWGKKVGKLLRDEGRGMFAITPEEKRRISGRTGMILLQTGKGIHAQTDIERSEVSKLGVISKGFVPLSTEVTTFVRSLDLNNPEYLTMKKQVDATKIAKDVNEKFYEGRNVIKADTISSFILRMKKRGSSTN